MNDIERVENKVDALLLGFATLRRDLENEKLPGLTATAFAEKAGISETTVYRMLARGELRRVKGKIPHEQLRPFLS
jgi:predicted transcriptional regulator